MNQARNYIMDDPREAQRLLDKVDAASWISKYFEGHLQDAKAVLSVGCGPGVFLREMAEIHPDLTPNLLVWTLAQSESTMRRPGCTVCPTLAFK